MKFTNRRLHDQASEVRNHRVEVIWTDADCDTGWKIPDEVNRHGDIKENYSLGYVVEDTTAYLRICMTWTPDFWAEVLTIPRENIRRIRSVKL